jgi:cytoskeletal protein RodZ
MQTQTIGEILKQEREFHRLTLDELAKKTRIRSEYLQALESNQFDGLPSATFVKGYIRTYGQIFGFDYQPLLRMLRRDYKESARGQLVPREFITPVLRRPARGTPITYLMVALAVVMVTLLSYVGFQWYQLQLPPPIEISSPENNQVVGPQITLSGWTESDVVVTINTQPVTVQPDGSFETELSLTREGLTTISVEAVDRRGKTNLVQRTVNVKF